MRQRNLSAVFWAFVLSLALISGVFAAGSVTLNSPADVSFRQSDVRFYYTVSSNESISSCKLIISGSAVQSSSSITKDQQIYFDRSMSEGPYLWSVNCTESGGGVLASSSYNLTVDTTNPSVVLDSPSSGSSSISRTLNFLYTPSDIIIKNCSLYTNSTGEMVLQQSDLSITNNAQNSFSDSLSDGDYKWNVKCYDYASNNAFASSDHVIRVDSTAPSILSSSPSGIISDTSATLSVTTDENATCRYSTSDVNYTQMSAFSTTGLTTHSVSLTGLVDNTYKYYVKCNDTYGNVRPSSSIVEFEVSLLPTAEIKLSDESPVKAGTVEVKLTTSKEMQYMPTLTYSFDGSGSQNKVSLTGSGSEWKGYLIIKDNNEKKIGTFSFSGTDKKGKTGTEITKGSLFIVDTIDPSAPTNLKAKALENGDILIEWHSEDDDIGTFNIYRSTSSGATLLDYYTSTNNTRFVDKSTTDKVTYYYKLATVDTAGNTGPLSNEVYATSVFKSVSSKSEPVASDEVVEKPLPPDLVLKVNDNLKIVENLLLDLKLAASNLQSDDAEISKIIAELKLINTVDSAHLEMQSVKEDLEEMKKYYMTESQLDSELNDIDLKIKKIRQTVPREVTLGERTESFQSITEEDLAYAANLLLDSVGSDDAQREAYLEYNKKHQNEVDVESEITTLDIEYLDGSKQGKTLFVKKISHDNIEPLRDISVMEIIPKSIAEDVSYIQFMTGDYTVVKEDPVVKWGFFELSRDGVSISYLVDGKASLSDSKKALSVILFNNMGKPTPVTGFSIVPDISSPKSIGIWIGIIFIIGLAGYYLLFVKGDFEMFRGKAKSFATVPKTMKKASTENNEAEDSGTHMQFNALLSVAEKFVEESCHDKARAIYPEICSLYKGLPGNHRKGYYQRCAELHKNLGKK